MNVAIQLLIIATCIVWNSHAALDFDDRKEQVIFSNIIFRHGDRTPIAPYRNDLYKNQSFWPVPFGSLTSIGEDQHRRLGLWLRSKYDHLFGRKYDPDLTYVRTTEVRRVQEAAGITLQAIFSDKANQPEVFFLRVIPTEFDNILGVRRKCQEYDKELQKVLRSPRIQELDRSNRHFYEFLSNHTGEKVTNLMDIPYIYDALLVEKIHNKTWPEWTRIDNKLWDRLENLNKDRIMLFANTTKMKRFKSGLLIGDMVNHMIMKAQNRLHSRNINIYSAHDDTIVNLLMALDLFEPHAPSYAATLGIELRSTVSEGYFVTIFYKSLDEEPIYLKLKGCDAMCPLEQFENLMHPLIPENWEQECNQQYNGPKNQLSALYEKI